MNLKYNIPGRNKKVFHFMSSHSEKKSWYLGDGKYPPPKKKEEKETLVHNGSSSGQHGVSPSFPRLAVHQARCPDPLGLVRFWEVRFCPHLPLRPSSPLHSFSAALLFCRRLSVQNTILSHIVQWSALILVELLEGSSYMEPTPHFYLSRILRQLWP